MKLTAILLLFCACAFLRAQTAAAPASAPAIDPEKTALIRQLIEAVDSERLRRTVLDIKFARYMALMRQNPIYPSGYVDELDKRIKQRAEGMDLVQLLTPIYDAHFSTDEVRQILAFRTSAVGRRLQALQPEMMAEVAKRANQWGQEVGPELAKEIFAEHPEYEKQIQENKQRMGSTSSGGTPEGTRSATGAFPIGGGVSAPTLVDKTEPQYTADAKSARVEGSVLLGIIVDENGIPRNIHVLRSLGFGLDEKAMEAVGQWRFRPGVKDGQPVATKANVEVNFRLLKKPPQ